MRRGLRSLVSQGNPFALFTFCRRDHIEDHVPLSDRSGQWNCIYYYPSSSLHFNLIRLLRPQNKQSNSVVSSILQAFFLRGDCEFGSHNRLLMRTYSRILSESTTVEIRGLGVVAQSQGVESNSPVNEYYFCESYTSTPSSKNIIV